MNEPRALLCPEEERHDCADSQGLAAQSLTHEQQIAEYVRIVEEARMRT